MPRFFNTTGLCRPEDHYMVEPLRGIKPELDKIFENKQYFLIHAPRQTGKTTLLHALAKQVNEEGKYICVVFSIENAGYRGISIEDAMYTYLNSLYIMAYFFLDKKDMPPPIDAYKPSNNVFFNYLSDWCRSQKKPVILLIDEIDSVWDDVLITTLRQLRNGFQVRPKAFPVSIALVGLRDIRDFKLKIREQDGVLGSGSPFNIKAESFRLESFTKEQVKKLYLQHTNDTGQVFSDEVINLAFDYTAGQPWLVNALANEIVAKILKNDVNKEITVDLVDKAAENLIKRRDTHLDSLMDKLNETKVHPIIESIISGEAINPDSYNNDLQYTIDLGIVKEQDGLIIISNKIYVEIIPRVLNKNMQDRIAAVTEYTWFIKDGKLQMDLLLKEFQQFYRENAEIWLDKFSYNEAGKQLLLMAFLQRILNGGGKIQREMAYGRGRTDLVVEFNGERFVLELKIKRSNYNHKRTLDQLSRYLDTAGENHGYLVLFEPKPSNEISWDDRIKWESIKYEFMGVTRNITIVQM